MSYIDSVSVNVQKKWCEAYWIWIEIELAMDWLIGTQLGLADWFRVGRVEKYCQWPGMSLDLDCLDRPSLRLVGSV